MLTIFISFIFVDSSPVTTPESSTAQPKKRDYEEKGKLLNITKFIPSNLSQSSSFLILIFF